MNDMTIHVWCSQDASHAIDKELVKRSLIRGEPFTACPVCGAELNQELRIPPHHCATCTCPDQVMASGPYAREKKADAPRSSD